MEWMRGGTCGLPACSPACDPIRMCRAPVRKCSSRPVVSPACTQRPVDPPACCSSVVAFNRRRHSYKLARCVRLDLSHFQPHRTLHSPSRPLLSAGLPVTSVDANPVCASLCPSPCPPPPPHCSQACPLCTAWSVCCSRCCRCSPARSLWRLTLGTPSPHCWEWVRSQPTQQQQPPTRPACHARARPSLRTAARVVLHSLAASVRSRVLLCVRVSVLALVAVCGFLGWWSRRGSAASAATSSDS